VATLAIQSKEEMSLSEKRHIAPIPHLFRLCRQFKTKYEDSFKDGFTITFKDLGSSSYEPMLERDLDRYTKAEALILLYCESVCSSDVIYLCGWIPEALTKLSLVKYVKLEIYTCV
jgi:hypothetical protein